MSTPTSPLRIVTFNVLPFAFEIVTRWAAQAGHHLVLTVTSPGPASRRGKSYQQLVANAPPDLEILVTTRLRKVALPLIRALEPDLIVSFTFPYRIPPEVRAVPRLGAVNLHPTPLPAYRGPNPLRLFYEGWPTMGATLHWMDDDFDTGLVLSQQTAPVPAQLTPQTLVATWGPLVMGALAEGTARAIAGEAGSPQDETAASYGGAFTEAEHWLDLREPMQSLQRKCTALNVLNPGSARIRVDGMPYALYECAPFTDLQLAQPGTLIEDHGEALIAQAGDGQVRLVIKPLL